ncbi:uncharacterized protein LOC129252925 [Anastrepha obliqua]|uniref:uncharacterized protein LOC129252925 n=1 Tax=Anastrepha obliqua TaxID=95512 RepID=UPI002409707E|nr:uncharacterized protein LOC129252925 [Anastrepha obliqua]
MELHLLAFYIILLGYTRAYAAEQEANYKLILDKLTADKEAEDIVKVKVELDKSEDAVKINGEVEQLIDMDNTWKVKLVFKRADEANEEYTEMMALPAMGICDFLKIYYRMYVYKSLVKYSNAPSPYICPIVKNTYFVKEYPFTSDKLKSIINPGFYRMEAILYHEDEEKFKYSLEGHVVEEK